MERKSGLVAPAGWVGVVVPSAFHANEGATAIRHLYLDKMAMRCCYSFENRRRLFEIDSRFKFAIVIAQAGRPTQEVSCAFYLHDDEWLFGERRDRQPLSYTIGFLRVTGGDYLSLLELRWTEDLVCAETCLANAEPFHQACARRGIQLGRELNSSDDSPIFAPTADLLRPDEDPRCPETASAILERGYLVLHEGRTFHQYTDRWEDRNRYCVPLQRIADRASVLVNTRFFKLSYRKISASTNERTAIFAMLQPGVVGVDYSPTEQQPRQRPSKAALEVLAVSDSFPADFCLRLYVSSSTVNYFFLSRMAFPKDVPSPLLSHSALRLSCNHPGYAPLWREQLGDEWREPGKPPFTWPVLAGDDARWAVRAAIDAVVADAYGLSREQYAHVLSTFSHTSYRNAPELCLAKFEELKQIGLDAFTRKYDPYHDIPLNENLPQPVIDLPIPGDDGTAASSPQAADQEPASTDGTFRLSRSPQKSRRGRGRK